MANESRIPGAATAQATRAYAEQQGASLPESHFSDFLKTRIRLSSLGIGTFPGTPDTATDARVAALIARGLNHGINVIDTAAHYRYGRALAAVGAGIQQAITDGVPREAMYLISKGGFVTFWDGRPESPRDWIRAQILEKGLAQPADLANEAHLLAPDYIEQQLAWSLEGLGVETLDAFLVDQPEVHIPVIGKERVNQKLRAIFEVLERAVSDGRLKNYGIATFEGCRVETDAKLFQSLTSMQGLAEKAAQEATGDSGASHHFKLVSLPYNQAMLEGFTRFNQATGQGNVASTLQGAHQLGVYMLGSHGLLKGRLAELEADVTQQTLGDLANPAQRALQFNRSTPGLGTTLVGLSTPEHLDDVLAVASHEPVDRRTFLGMFQKA